METEAKDPDKGRKILDNSDGEGAFSKLISCTPLEVNDNKIHILFTWND